MSSDSAPSVAGSLPGPGARWSPKLDELHAQSEAGLPLGTDMRLGEWLDWYQEMIEAEKNPSTCANCAWVIKQLTATARTAAP